MRNRVETRRGDELAKVVDGVPGMKVVVRGWELVSAINRGGLAAVTEEGRRAVAEVINPTIGCIRIAADDSGIRFESATRRFSSMCALKAGGGVRVVERGEVCVLFKELKSACSMIPKGREVSLSFVPDANDGVALTSPPAARWCRCPNGTVEIGFAGDGGVIARVRIESYRSGQFIQAEYPDAAGLSMLLKGKATAIKEPYGIVRLAIEPKSIDERASTVAVRCTQQCVSFMGTDMRRCAIATRSKKTFVATANTDLPLLIDAEILTLVLKTIPDDEDVTLATDGDEDHAYIYCGAARYRFMLPEGTLRARYPDVRKLQRMPMGAVLLLDSAGLAAALGRASLVNKDRCVLTFSGKGSVGILAKGLGVPYAFDASVRCERVSGPPLKTPSVGMSSRHLKDYVSRLRGRKARLSFSRDETKIRIEDEIDPLFTCFMQVTPRPI